MKLFIFSRLQSTEDDEQESWGGDNQVDEGGGQVWPGVKGHAVSTGTDTNAQRAWRDQRFGGSSSTQDHFLLLQFLPSSPLLL